MSPPKEVDVIISGGGAAGCVLAGRLAAADPNLEILLIEAGRNNLDDPQVIRPAVYLSHLAPTSTTAHFYVGRESEHLAGRKPIVPVGSILGGGSSINFMMYTRASASDYDDWKTEGWSSKDLIPLLKKIESYDGLGKNSTDIHGFDGPLKVSYGSASYRPKIMEEFLNVAEERGYPVVDDLQDFKKSNGFEQWAKWIDPKTGRRCDAAHGYVHPQTGKSKLHILCDSKVARVIIKDKKAVGVEYVPTQIPEGSDEPKPLTIKARKLVVLSAGALGSPQILERSGVGAEDVLKKAGVELEVNLPGVGTNYQDHNLILPAYRVSPDTDTHDDFLRGDPETIKQATADLENGEGKFVTNMIDCGGKVRPNEKELAEMGPEFRKFWNEYYRDSEDKPVMFAGIINAFLGDHSLVPPGKYITVGTYLEYPASRGTIHITSKSPYATPDFDPGFLTHPADLPANVWGYKLGRELVRRMPCYRGEPTGLHPNFSVNSTARTQEIDHETSQTINGNSTSISGGLSSGGIMKANDDSARASGGKIEDLVYSEEDDKAVEQYIRENIATTWHSMGTLAMKPREDGGVVDSKLNVYGVENLKIADISICPGNVGSNTYSTALLVGEKAALLCGEHLGITNI